MRFSHKKVFDYIIIILLIFISGNPFFYGEKYLVFSFVLLSLTIILKKIKPDSVFLGMIVFLILIFVFQSYKFRNFPAFSIIGVFINVGIAYLVVKLADKNFIKYFIKIMFILAIISLIFWSLIVIFPFVKDFLISISYGNSYGEYPRFSILIYTLIPGNAYRNTGAFWEAGAFGGYLTLAFLYNLILENHLKTRKNIVFIIAILTTISTTAYIAIFIIFIFYSFVNNSNLAVKILLVSFVLFLTIVSFTNLDFLLPKVKDRFIKSQIEDFRTSSNSSRFMSFQRDYYDFKGHEFIGRGPFLKNRYSHETSTSTIRTNGFSDFIVRFGALFFIFSTILFTRSQKRFILKENSDTKYYLLTIIVYYLLLQSETYMNYPLFWCFLFLSVVYSETASSNNIFFKNSLKTP